MSIKNSRNVRVSSVYVTQCTGDGVIVSGWQEKNTNEFTTTAKNVLLEKIVSDDNRRQVLTVGHVDG